MKIAYNNNNAKKFYQEVNSTIIGFKPQMLMIREKEGNIVRNKGVGTPTYHSISYSIPFHLTALLPLSVHHSTHQPSQQHLNHHRKPLSHSLLLCLLPNKGNGPWEVELHPTSHAYQLCQTASGRADWTAGDLCKRRPSNQREAVHRKGVTVNNTRKKKLGKTGGTTARPRCLVDRAHHRSSGASSSSPSEPVAAASIPPRTSGQSTA